MRKEIILILPVFAAVILPLAAAIGVSSVTAQNMTGNETAGNLTGGANMTTGGNMTNATEGGNMTGTLNMTTPTTPTQ